MTSTALKLIALLLMTIDHIGVFLPGMPLWLRYIGRLSACTFFFCAVEGFTHTRDKKRYVMRLYLMSLGMTVLDIVLPMLMGRSEIIGSNVFLELTGMMLLLYLLDGQSGNRKKQLCIVVLYFVYQFGTSFLLETVLRYESQAAERLAQALLGCFVGTADSNVLYVDMLILLFWMCRGNKKHLAAAFSAYCMLQIFWNVLAVPSYLPVLGELFPAMHSIWDRAFRTDFQWMMLFALPLLLSYNGQKGKGLKWLFYIFYPVHIGLLYLLGVYLH